MRRGEVHSMAVQSAVGEDRLWVFDPLRQVQRVRRYGHVRRELVNGSCSGDQTERVVVQL
jgi:hypothetical protein